MLISIIIPVYNVSQWIGRCLHSALNQTYPEIEYILVDDATPDDSMEIVAEILHVHPRKDWVKMVRHPENKGLAAARNTGVRQATGDYIFFLDSDDEIVPNCIEILAAFTRQQAVDFVIGEIEVLGNRRKAYPPLHLKDGTYLNGNQCILKFYLQRQWYEMAWNKLIKRRIFTESKIWFEEGIVHEDTLWSFQLALAAQSMAVSQAHTYMYHIQANSITQKKSKKNIADFYFVLDKIIRLSSAKNLFGRQKSIFRYLEQSRIFFVKTLIINDFDNNYISEQKEKLDMLFAQQVWTKRRQSLLASVKEWVLLIWLVLKRK